MTKPLFDPRRNPYADVRAALEEARRDRKNVLIDIGGDWCVWCQRLEEFIASHADLAQLRDQHYVLVRVYLGEEDQTNWEFLRQLPQIAGVPHLLVYNGRGLLLHSQPTEPLEEGESYAYERVRAFLAEWSDWRRSPYDALETSELKQRFEQLLRPRGDAPVPSA